MKRKINELGDYLYGLLPLPFSKRAKAAPSQPAPTTTRPQHSCSVDEFHIACKEGNDREVEKILQEVSSDNSSLDIQCGLHLTTGSRVGHAACASLLLMSGARVTYKDKEGNQPLHLSESEEMVSLLLKSGANINAVNDELNTPLHTAGFKKLAPVVVALINAGADINLKNRQNVSAIEALALTPVAAPSNNGCSGGATSSTGNHKDNVNEKSLVEELAPLLIELELCLKWSSMASWWGGSQSSARTSWLSYVIRANTFTALVKSVIELESAIQWNAVNVEWRAMRAEWLLSMGPSTSFELICDSLCTFVEHLRSSSLEMRFQIRRWTLRVQMLSKRLRNITYSFPQETCSEYVRCTMQKLGEVDLVQEPRQQACNFVTVLQALQKLYDLQHSVLQSESLTRSLLIEGRDGNTPLLLLLKRMDLLHLTASRQNALLQESCEYDNPIHKAWALNSQLLTSIVTDMLCSPTLSTTFGGKIKDILDLVVDITQQRIYAMIKDHRIRTDVGTKKLLLFIAEILHNSSSVQNAAIAKATIFRPLWIDSILSCYLQSNCIELYDIISKILFNIICLEPHGLTAVANSVMAITPGLLKGADGCSGCGELKCTCLSFPSYFVELLKYIGVKIPPCDRASTKHSVAIGNLIDADIFVAALPYLSTDPSLFPFVTKILHCLSVSRATKVPATVVDFISLIRPNLGGSTLLFDSSGRRKRSESESSGDDLEDYGRIKLFISSQQNVGSSSSSSGGSVNQSHGCINNATATFPPTAGDDRSSSSTSTVRSLPVHVNAGSSVDESTPLAPPQARLESSIEYLIILDLYQTNEKSKRQKHSKGNSADSHKIRKSSRQQRDDGKSKPNEVVTPSQCPLSKLATVTTTNYYLKVVANGNLIRTAKTTAFIMPPLPEVMIRQIVDSISNPETNRARQGRFLLHICTNAENSKIAFKALQDNAVERCTQVSHYLKAIISRAESTTSATEEVLPPATMDQMNVLINTIRLLFQLRSINLALCDYSSSSSKNNTALNLEALPADILGGGSTSSSTTARHHASGPLLGEDNARALLELFQQLLSRVSTLYISLQSLGIKFDICRTNLRVAYPLLEALAICVTPPYTAECECLKTGTNSSSGIHQCSLVLGQLGALEYSSAKRADGKHEEQQHLSPALKYWIELCNILTTHRQLITSLVSEDLTLLSENRNLSFLKAVPSLLSVDTKMKWFNMELSRSSMNRDEDADDDDEFHLKVTRESILRDTFAFLDSHHVKDKAVKDQHLQVTFNGENGSGPGLRREWFSALSNILFSNASSWFDVDLVCGASIKASSIHSKTTAEDEAKLLREYESIGKLFALGLIHNLLWSTELDLVFLKQITGEVPTYQDFKNRYPDVGKSMDWILENKISETSGLTFVDTAGEVELIPNGSETPVTDENKRLFVSLVMQSKFNESGKQRQALLRGLFSCIGPEKVAVFNAAELKLLLCGEAVIDVEDWKRNTVLTDFLPTDKTVVWFWRAVESFDNGQRSLLLKFATGMKRAPLEGFKALSGSSGQVIKFQLANSGKSSKYLPESHTCFNQLSIPSTYRSYKVLRHKLLQCIHEGSEYFGLT